VFYFEGKFINGQPVSSLKTKGYIYDPHKVARFLTVENLTGSSGPLTGTFGTWTGTFGPIRVWSRFQKLLNNRTCPDPLVRKLNFLDWLSLD